MRDAFSASPFWGDVAVATSAAAQALTRYVADRFVERHSPVPMARVLRRVLALRRLQINNLSLYTALVMFYV
jgi:hypothetical protein